MSEGAFGAPKRDEQASRAIRSASLSEAVGQALFTVVRYPHQLAAVLVLVALVALVPMVTIVGGLISIPWARLMLARWWLDAVRGEPGFDSALVPFRAGEVAASALAMALDLLVYVAVTGLAVVVLFRIISGPGELSPETKMGIAAMVMLISPVAQVLTAPLRLIPAAIAGLDDPPFTRVLRGLALGWSVAFRLAAFLAAFNLLLIALWLGLLYAEEVMGVPAMPLLAFRVVLMFTVHQLPGLVACSLFDQAEPD